MVGEVSSVFTLLLLVVFHARMKMMVTGLVCRHQCTVFNPCQRIHRFLLSYAATSDFIPLSFIPLVFRCDRNPEFIYH